MSKLEELGILKAGTVKILPVSPAEELPMLQPCDAVYIVNKSEPHSTWLRHLARNNTPLVFCQDAVGLATVVYSPILRSEVPATYTLVGTTVPAHATVSPQEGIHYVTIASSDVFLTTAAFAAVQP